MENYPLVKDFFPINSGLFSHCEYDFGSLIDKEKLDVMFYTNYATRTVAPLAKHLVTGDKPTSGELEFIASFLVSYYKIKWDKLKDLYLSDYDPLHNYLDELTETIEGSGSKALSSSSSDVSSSTLSLQTDTIREDNLTRLEAINGEEEGSGSTDTSVFGFNSDSPVPSDTIDNSNGSSFTSANSLTNTGTQSYNVSKTGENSSGKNVESESSEAISNTTTKISTHKGNIGNLTTQQLVSQEIKLRQWNFIESVLEDAKELLTIPLYL